MLDRRAFLRRLGFGTVSVAAAVCTFDLEKLLWLPGEKTIIEVTKPLPTLIQRIGLSVQEYQWQLTKLSYHHPQWDAVKIMQESAFIIESTRAELILVS